MPWERPRGSLLLPRFVASSLSLERSRTPLLLAQRPPGELRRPDAAGLLRRPTAVRTPSRRHGASRFDVALIAAALSPGEERFFLAVRSLLVFFFFVSVNGPAERLMEGVVYARGRHRAAGTPSP